MPIEFKQSSSQFQVSIKRVFVIAIGAGAQLKVIYATIFNKYSKNFLIKYVWKSILILKSIVFMSTQKRPYSNSKLELNSKKVELE